MNKRIQYFSVGLVALIIIGFQSGNYEATNAAEYPIPTPRKVKGRHRPSGLLIL